MGQKPPKLWEQSKLAAPGEKREPLHNMKDKLAADAIRDHQTKHLFCRIFTGLQLQTKERENKNCKLTQTRQCLREKAREWQHRAHGWCEKRHSAASFILHLVLSSGERFLPALIHTQCSTFLGVLQTHLGD